MADHAFQLQQLLLGSLEARLAGSPLVFPTRKTLALLTYLALAEGPQPREHLAAPPWPDASPERSHPFPAQHPRPPTAAPVPG
jgi:DNA-binding SARP family transcriptional activator